MRRSVLASALAATLASFGTACGGGGADVLTPNQLPAVTATAVSPVPEGLDILLVGASSDPDGDPLSHAWTVTSQPPDAAALLDDPAAIVSTVSGLVVPGLYEFQLTVSDGQASASATVEVFVTSAAAAQEFLADREAFPLTGVIGVSAPDAGGPPFATPFAYTPFEGGWSGLSRVRDALGGYVSDEFWVVNDRGPNYAIANRVPALPMGATAFGTGAKYFPLPAYQQKLLRLRLNRATGEIAVVSTTGIRNRAGLATNGLPSSVVGMTTADVAYADFNDKSTVLGTSATGFDFEGVCEDRMTIAGVDRRVFWTGDEYGPAIQMLEADPASANFGQMIREYVPGVVADNPSGLYTLPASLRQRRDNRGFEGLAVTYRAVWAMVQSNMKAAFGSATSRLHRLVRVDKASGVATVYAYDHIDDPAFYGTTHANVKVGDMVAIGEREFLVLEHDGTLYAHVYRIRVKSTTTPLLESESGNYEKGLTPYVPVEKTLIADLTQLMLDLRVPNKPEGLVLLDPQTLALCFDNDYGFDANDLDVYPKPGDQARNMIVQVRLPAPVIPSLSAVADYNMGLPAANSEIVSYDPSLGLGLASCGADFSIQAFDLADPTVPTFVRRDAIVGGGDVTSVVAHPTRGYYLAAARKGGGGGVDVVFVRDTATGALLRTLDIGLYKDVDAVTISPNGRWAVVCNEAEDPWQPGSIAVIDLGAGPFATAAAAAAGIVGVNEIALSGLTPSVGAFSTRWYDRVYNTIPVGVTATVGGFPIVLFDINTRAQANGVNVPDQADVVFTFGATSVTGKYRLDAGGDGNTFIFQLDGSARSIEPELASFSADSTTCVVTLQEVNAVAVLDFTLAVPAIRATNGVLALGKVDQADADVVNSGAGAGAAFKDVLQREREPDGVNTLVLDGIPCFVTIDEGDSFGALPTDSSNSRFRGGRTISIFRLSDGALLSDTGNRLDAMVNSVGRWGAFVEGGNRSRRGGSEPENADVVHWGDRTLLVVGCERAHALVLVDVTDPYAPTVLDVAGLGGLGASAQLAPEGIKAFVKGTRSFVLVGFETSGTVGVFEVR